MSTYTDLHNRVQESINVDYVTRKTPQKVILANKENEYYGTFHGQVDIENIDVNGGTISGVTIQDAVLSGVQLCAVDGLNIDLGDYVKKDEIDELCTRFDTLERDASQAARDAASALVSARAAFDGIGTYKDSVESKIDGIRTEVNNIDTALTNGINQQLEATKTEVNSVVGSLCTMITGQGGVNERIEGKDTVRDREIADASLSTNLKIAYEAADSMLCTNVLCALDTSNLALCAGLSTMIDTERELRENDDTKICTLVTGFIDNKINTETERRTAADTYISGAVDTANSDISDLSDALTDEVQNRATADQNVLQSAMLSLDTEIAKRHDDDQFLSGQLDSEVANRTLAINQLNSNLTDLISGISSEITCKVEGEIYRSTNEDARINQKIDNVSAASLESDNAIVDTLCETSTLLDNSILATKNDVLSTLEHDRHYLIQTENGNTCPLKADDMAVNIFDINLPDGRLIYHDEVNGVDVPVAQVNILNANPLRLNVRTYDGITNKSIASAIVQNTSYTFSDDHTATFMSGKGYDLKYEAGTTWKDSRFWLDPVVNEFFNIKVGEQVVGKVFDAEVEYNENNQPSRIVSGVYTIDIDDSVLSVFNDGFTRVPFNDSSMSSYSRQPNKITYNGDNTFKFEYNLDNRRYISIEDVLGFSSLEFGRIYDHIGLGLTSEIESGIDYDEGEISKIRVVATLSNYLPDTYTVNLRREQDFTAILASGVQDPLNGKTYNYYLKADVDGSRAKFTAYKAARMYKYAFTYRDFDTPNDEEKTSYITPLLYNKTIADVGGDFPTASVDLTKAPIWVDFKKTYTLVKNGFADEWIYHKSNDDGSFIEIKYNLLKLFITEATPGAHVVARHEYDVGIQAIESSSSDVIDLFQSEELDISTYPESAGIAESTFPAAIDLIPRTSGAVVHQLTFDTEHSDKIDIVVPDKIDYGAGNQISREFMVVLRLKNNNQTELATTPVEINFINSLGQDVTFYNGSHTDYFLAKNKWTTLQLNEIRSNIFILNDIDQNEDKLKFDWLKNAIETEAQTRTDQYSELTNYNNTLSGYLGEVIQNAANAHEQAALSISTNYQNINTISGNLATSASTLEQKINTDIGSLSAELSGALSDSIRFKGNVLLKDDYDEHETHNHMSALLKTCTGFAANSSLKRGFTFRCAEGNQAFAEITENGTDILDIDENDYLILKCDCILSDTTIDDFEIVKDFSHWIEALSNASDNKYFILSADNTATGSNTFNDAKVIELSASAAKAQALSANVLSAASITAETKLSATSADISTLSGNVVSATALTASSISSQTNNFVSVEAENMSANNISAEKETMQSAYVSALSATALSAASLEADALTAKNISATTALSATKADIATLSGSTVSANALTAVNLSGQTNNFVSATATNLTATSANISSLTVVNQAISNLTADKLTANLLKTPVSAEIEKLSGNIAFIKSLTATSLSTSSISAVNSQANNLTATAACMSALSVPTFEKIFDVATTSSLADNISSLTSDIDSLSNGLTTVVSAVNDALLSNQTITETQPVTQGHTQRTMVVSKLVLVDEVNFNKYTLTIRNGALNIDKITA